MKTRLNIALILSGAMLFLSSTLFAQNLTVEGLSTLEGGTATGSLRPLTTNTGPSGMNTIGVIGGNSENKFINFRAGGASFANTGIMFSNFSVDHFLMYRTGNGLSFRFSNENTDLPDLTATTEYMVLSTSGNLGIGETNPTSKLDVNGDTELNGSDNDGLTNATLKIKAGTQTMLLDGNEIDVVGGNTLFLNGSAGGDVSLTTAASGNVGIGTSTPLSKLDIRGTSLLLSPVGLPTTFAANSPNNYVEKNDFKIQSSNNGLYMSTSAQANQRTAYLQVGHSNSAFADFVGSLHLNPFGGNIGIGLTASSLPTARLDVNGTARIRSLPSGSGTTVVADASGNLLLSSSSPNVNEQRINDLEQENELLKAELEQIKDQFADLKALVSSIATTNTTSHSSSANLTSANLSQNAPNPFDEVTTISYFIPEHIKSASLQFMDQNGRIIKTIPIQATGHGQVTLQANALTAGAYSYALILDGQVMAMKQMVLTR